jgi:thiamine kinase-like enzyme
MWQNNSASHPYCLRLYRTVIACPKNILDVHGQLVLIDFDLVQQGHRWNDIGDIARNILYYHGGVIPALRVLGAYTVELGFSFNQREQRSILGWAHLLNRCDSRIPQQFNAAAKIALDIVG